MNGIEYKATGSRFINQKDKYHIYIPVESRCLIGFNNAVVVMTDDGFKMRESTILDNKTYSVTKTPTQLFINILSKHMDLSGDFEMEVIGDWIYFIKDI